MTNNRKDEARSALDEMGIAERRLAAAAADCPPWRHAVFGLVMAASVATPAVAMPARLAVPALVFFAVLMIFQSDRRRTGMFVNGYRRGKTLGLTLGLLVVIMGLLMLSIRAGERGDTGTVILLSVAGFVISVGASIAWQRIFLREMGA